MELLDEAESRKYIPLCSDLFSDESIGIAFTRWRKGEFLSIPDEQPHFLLFIVEGHVRWSAYREDGSESVLASGERDVIGDIEAVTGKPSLFYAEAMTDIIAAAVDLRRYGKALREDRKFLSMTVQRMAMKFEAISLETAYSRSAEDRLLSYIERTCGGHLTNASQAASVLHVSRRHIQRMLRKLSEEGILEHKGRGSYTISDPAGSKHCQRADKKHPQPFPRGCFMESYD